MPAKRLFSFAMMICALFLIFTHVQAEAASKKKKVITLRYATMDAKQSWTATHSLIPWMQAVEKAADGQVKFEPYWSNTLSKPFDNWESVKSGVADAGDCVMAFWPGLAPLSDVISLPFIGVQSAEQAGATLWKLYEKYPSIQTEYKDVHVLFLAATNPNVLMTTKKQVKSTEDIKGLKLRVTSGPATNYMKGLGASPMMVSMNDVYMNLQKGVIDGIVTSWTTIRSMRFHEVVDYVNNVPIYSTFAARVMNKNTWNRLPKDVQDAFTQCSGLERSIEFSRTQFDEQCADVKKAGFKVVQYTPSKAEMDQWKASAESIQQKWLSDMEAAGHSDAKDILATTKALLNSYQK